MLWKYFSRHWLKLYHRSYVFMEPGNRLEFNDCLQPDGKSDNDDYLYISRNDHRHRMYEYQHSSCNG